MRRIGPLVLLLVVYPLSAQTGELAPGPNLVVDGVPKIPSALEEKVQKYTKFGGTNHIDWHPTKSEMLVSTRAGDTVQIHELTAPEGKPRQLTKFPDAVAGASYPPHTADYFIFSKGAGGNERFQLYRFDRGSGEIVLLTDGKSRNTSPRFSNKGDRLVYVSTRRNGADSDFFVMNPADPKTDKLLLENKGGGWFPLSWSPDDQRLLYQEYVSINESHLWELDLATGDKKRLNKPGDKAIAFAGARYTPDGQGIFLITDQDSEFRRFVLWDPPSNKFTYMAPDIKWDIEAFAVQPHGDRIALLVNEEGQSRVHFVAADPDKTAPQIQLPPGSINGMHWHRDGKKLAFNLVSAKAPSDVHVLNVETNQIERWTKTKSPTDPADFADPELIRWKSFDDRTISGYLYAPPRKFKGMRPVVIDIHGGPESQFRPGFLARKNFFLNELGVALIFPNVRGSSGYGKTFLTLDNGFKREDAYKDIGALLDWIAKRDDLDANRVMVTGGSYGGHMTLAVATYYPDRIRCAVDIVGISNLVTLLENTEPYRRDLRRVEYGDERDPKMRAFLNQIAPVNRVNKITKPLFIVQGKNDPRVPLSEAEQMVAAVKKNGTPVWYLQANDEGHGFAKKKNADFQFYATILFMERFLLDGLKEAQAEITPTAAYEVKRVHGFKVYIHPDVVKRDKEYGEALAELASQFQKIEKVLPPHAYKTLSQVPFWMEWDKKKSNAAEYHVSPDWLKANGYNPDKVHGVEIANVRLFLRSSGREQPWMVLHELAHAYHFRVLGADHTGVQTAYKQAMERKLYDQVKHINGKTMKAYAATNDKEYFAELSEAYFGKNDFYPFNREELRQHDPEGYKMLEAVWLKK